MFENASDEELNRYIASAGQFRFEAVEERKRRAVLKAETDARVRHEALLEASRQVSESLKRLEKTHWPLTPTFWVTVVILIVGILTWLFPKEPKKERSPTDAPVRSNSAILTYTATPQTNSPKSPLGLPVAGKTSPPAILKPTSNP